MSLALLATLACMYLKDPYRDLVLFFPYELFALALLLHRYGAPDAALWMIGDSVQASHVVPPFCICRACSQLSLSIGGADPASINATYTCKSAMILVQSGYGRTNGTCRGRGKFVGSTLHLSAKHTPFAVSY